MNESPDQLQPRRYGVQGQVLAKGLFFDPNQLSEPQIRSRILENWQVGARVYQADGYRLLVWPTPRWLSTKSAPTYPLLAYGDHLSSLELAPSELAIWNEGEPQILFVLHGRIRAIPMRMAQSQDPAQWLPLQHIQQEFVESLGTPPPLPKLTELAGEDTAVEHLRNQKIGTDPRQQAMLKALQTGQSNDLSAGSNPGLWNSLRTLFQAMRQSLRIPSPNSSKTSTDAPPPTPLRDLLVQAMLHLRLGSLFEKRQANYLRQMLNLFESGNLDEALRQAIPLSSLQNSVQSSRPSLGVPHSRQSLEINPHAAKASQSVSLGEAFFEHLRRTYEATFQKLDRAQRYQEAAFVLAELLKDDSRAVDYLERHGQFRLAAELAEGRSMPAPRIVRQWLLAGDVERATRIALLTHCHLAAIQMIESKEPVLARRLREEFAQILAKAGQYFQAAELARPVETMRDQIHHWLEMAVVDGGPDGSQALIRLLASETSTPAHLDQAIRILQQSDRDSYAIRKTLVDALLNTTPTPALRTLAEHALRAELWDLSSAAGPLNKKRLRSLLDRLNNPALKADVQPLIDKINSSPPPPLSRQVPALQYSLEDSGSGPYTDIRRLANGHILLARGEGGIELVNGAGKRLRWFNTPCHRVVLAHSGNRALFLAHRGDYWRTSRFQLSNLSVTPWIDVRASRFTENYDGIQWLVAQDQHLWALDAQSEDSVALWQLSDLPANVSVLAGDDTQLGVVLSGKESLEYWRYAQPSMTLRERTPIARAPLQQCDQVAITTSGLLGGARAAEDGLLITFGRELQHSPWVKIADQEAVLRVSLHSHWMMVFSQAANSRCFLRAINIYAERADKVRLEIDTPDEHLLWRIEGDELLLLSSTGRVTGISLATGELLRKFIMS